MDRLTLLIKNRLVLAGTPAYEAPYAAREAVALAGEIEITKDADIVRLAVITRALGPVLHASSSDRELIFAVLLRRELTPLTRLDFIERTWLVRAPDAEGG